MSFITSTAAICLAAAVTSASPAASHFHLHLRRSEPGAHDTISTSPKVIRLWFTEKPAAAISRIELTTASGVKIPLGRPHLEVGKDPALAAKIEGTVPAGTSEVSWHTMGPDGHPMSGTFTFVVRAPASR